MTVVTDVIIYINFKLASFIQLCINYMDMDRALS